MLLAIVCSAEYFSLLENKNKKSYYIVYTILKAKGIRVCMPGKQPGKYMYKCDTVLKNNTEMCSDVNRIDAANTIFCCYFLLFFLYIDIYRVIGWLVDQQRLG